MAHGTLHSLADDAIATVCREWHVPQMHSVLFQPNQSDLVAAYKLNYRATIRSKRIMRTYLGGSAALAGIAAAAAWAWDIMSVPWAAAAGFAYWIVFLSAILGSAYLRLPSQVRKIFQQQKSLHEATTVEWSETGISFRSARGHSDFSWPDFVKIAAGADALIFRQSDALFNFIPTRALTSEQISDILRHKTL